MHIFDLYFSRTDMSFSKYFSRVGSNVTPSPRVLLIIKVMIDPNGFARESLLLLYSYVLDLY